MTASRAPSGLCRSQEGQIPGTPMRGCGPRGNAERHTHAYRVDAEHPPTDLAVGMEIERLCSGTRTGDKGHKDRGAGLEAVFKFNRSMVPAAPTVLLSPRNPLSPAPLRQLTEHLFAGTPWVRQTPGTSPPGPAAIPGDRPPAGTRRHRSHRGSPHARPALARPGWSARGSSRRPAWSG